MKTGIISDGIVTRDQIAAVIRHIRKHGAEHVAGELFLREPELMLIMANRFTQIESMLLAAGLTKKQAWDILKISRLQVLEAVTAVEQSNRNIWQSFLPDDNTDLKVT